MIDPEGIQVSDAVDLLTPNQVAELLGVAPVTVRFWARKGLLRAYSTPGGHRRFLRSDVEEFAREHGAAFKPVRTAGIRVLIVDDDPALTRFLVELLDGYEFPNGKVETAVADDGFQAGLRVREFSPAVMLLDLMMPGLDGFEVCRLMQSDPVTRGIRVIALTGFPTADNRRRILEAGARHFLAKPIDTNELLDAIGRGALSGRETRGR